MGHEAHGSAGAVESLYPFLYSGTTDLPAVLAEVGPQRSPSSARSLSCAGSSAHVTEPAWPAAPRRWPPDSPRVVGCSRSAKAAAPPMLSSSRPFSSTPATP